MNWSQYAKSKGANRVDLVLERHPIYASKQPSQFKVSNLKAWRLGNQYFWGNVIASKHGDWMESDKARWLILEESAA